MYNLIDDFFNDEDEEFIIETIADLIYEENEYDCYLKEIYEDVFEITVIKK